MSTSTHLMTAEDLLKLDGPYCYELVKGELLTMPLPGYKHGAVTMSLAGPLHVHVQANNLGVVVAAETGFILERNPDTVLGPDIAFIRNERISTSLPDGYLEVAPDLAVETFSPSQSRPMMERKASRWLEYGVVEVWLVDPKTRTVDIRRATGANQLLREGDDLTAGDLVPGFRIAVNEIFA
jgi:Uma2 family endonuclease